jgi:hypothetical protein
MKAVDFARYRGQCLPVYARTTLSAAVRLSLAACLCWNAQAFGQKYPLRSSANGRYLVDQANEPFLITGDAPQSLMVNISTSDADMYFGNRASRGFNAVWINLLCETYTAGRADGSTYDGIRPFTGYLPGHDGDPLYYDLTTPNPAYFGRCDQMLNLAASHGLVVLLDPIETGGFLPAKGGGNAVMPHNGAISCRVYGQYLGNRYRNFPNIIWMSGNDYQVWQDGVSDTLVTAVALGIKDNDPNHIHTVGLNDPSSGSLDDVNWASIISLNASYTYYPTYAQVLKDYNRLNFQPVFLVEANYEYEHWPAFASADTTPLSLRKQEYWTLLSGATGQVYGNYYVWRFANGWQNHLDSPGAIQIAHLKALFGPRAWYELVPDQSGAVVSAGRGVLSDSGYVEDNSYLTAARTPDGKLAIAYVPTIRSITVDMAQMSGAVTARWYDPTTGVYTSIDGSPFANSGPRSFTSPGNNAQGDGDWVLVLEVVPPPAPGDFNTDGHVDALDVQMLSPSWGKVRGEAGFNPACDVNGDGRVDVSDLLILAEGWAPRSGDINGDGYVDVTDLLMLARSWGESTGGADFDPACDVNGDERVDVSDLLVLAKSWAPLPGDANGDGRVDVSDLLVVARSWGLSLGDPGYDARCDFNGDDSVDVTDLMTMAARWGTCTADGGGD